MIDLVREYYETTTVRSYLGWAGQTLAFHIGLADDLHPPDFAATLLATNAFLADQAGIGVGATVLDAGCGVGGSAIWLARERGARVVGVTISPTQVSLAETFAARQAVAGVRFECGDYTAARSDGATFDVVWNLESICHAADPSGYVAMLPGLLRAGGRFACVDFFRGQDDDGHCAAMCDGWMMRRVDGVDAVAEALIRHGFEDVRVMDLTARAQASARVLRVSAERSLAALHQRGGATPVLERHYHGAIAAGMGLASGSIRYAYVGGRWPGSEPGRARAGILPGPPFLGHTWSPRPRATAKMGTCSKPAAVSALALALALASGAGTALHAQVGRALTVVDAVRTAVREHPDVKLLEEQVSISQAAALMAAGAFDLRYGGSLARQRDVRPLDAGDVRTNITAWRVGVDRPLRSGLVLSPTLTVERENFSLSSSVPNRTTAALNLTQPLLRGRGIDVVTARERAAAIDVAATGQELRQTVSATAARTLVSYWRYLAAVRSLTIFRESEGRSQRLVDDMRTLIAAGNRPAAEMRQVQANLADRTAFRLAAEHAVVEARETLGLAIGLPNDAIAALPLPADDFPDVPETLPPGGSRALVDMARDARADLDAARQRAEQARVLVTAATDAIKPKLDLQLGVGYAGFDSGRSFGDLLAPFDRASGPNLSLSFAYDWSAQNSAARGTLGAQTAARRQREIQANELHRSIGSTVVVAQNELVATAQRLRANREAANLYREAVENERERLRLGLGTILDLVVTEERMTRSLLEEVSTTAAYAIAIAQLRYETGTLIPATGPADAISADRLTTIPDATR